MKSFVLGICFLVLPYLTFGIELWNGFTTEMSKEDIISRARKMFDIGEREQIEIDDSPLPTTDSVGNAYPGGGWHGSEIERIIIQSPQEAYNQSWIGNIIAYVYKEKLFAIWVNWAARSEDVLNRAKGQFGNPQKTTDVRGHKSYYWSLPDKDFIVYITGSRGGFIYIDRYTQQSFVEEGRNMELDSRNREEARRRAAANAIQF